MGTRGARLPRGSSIRQGSKREKEEDMRERGRGSKGGEEVESERGTGHRHVWKERMGEG